MRLTFPFSFWPLGKGKTERIFPFSFARPGGESDWAFAYDPTSEFLAMILSDYLLADRRPPSDDAFLSPGTLQGERSQRQGYLGRPLDQGGTRKWRPAKLLPLLDGGLRRPRPAAVRDRLDEAVRRTLRMARVDSQTEGAARRFRRAFLPVAPEAAERLRKAHASVAGLRSAAERLGRLAWLEATRLAFDRLRMYEGAVDAAAPRADTATARAAWISDVRELVERVFYDARQLPQWTPADSAANREGEVVEGAWTAPRLQPHEGHLDPPAERAVRQAAEAALDLLLTEAQTGLRDAVLTRLMDDVVRGPYHGFLVEGLADVVRSGEFTGTVTELLQVLPEARKAELAEAAIRGEKSSALTRAIALDEICRWAERSSLPRPARLEPDHDELADWLDDDWIKIPFGDPDKLDLMQLPATDYDYSSGALMRQVVDENGAPKDPYGPINAADVDVYGSGLITAHPIPQYSEVGNFRVIVDTYVLRDVMAFILLQRRKDAARYATLSAQAAVWDLLDKLSGYVETMAGTEKYLEYQRAFRHVRWYGEAILNRQTICTIRRDYQEWKSEESLGRAGAPAIMEGVRIESGAFTSTTSPFRLELFLTNYIDARLLFNARLGKNASLRVEVDGVPAGELQEGTWIDFAYAVPMGEHAITFTGKGSAELARIRLEGHRFLGYRVLPDTQDTLQGPGALTLLFQMLLKYYEDHHTHKSKGGREHWIMDEPLSQ